MYESVSTTSASEIRFYKSKSQWIATTQIGARAGVANSEVIVVATSTVLDTTTAIFDKNDWIVVRQTGGVDSSIGGTVSPTGSCSAQFIQI